MTEIKVPGYPGPESALGMYRDVVDLGEESAPILTMGTMDNTVTVVMLHELSDHPTDALKMLVEMIERGQLALPSKWPIWAMVSADSYHAIEDRSGGTMRRGALRDRFNDGDPLVSEAIVVTMIHRGGYAFLATQRYVREESEIKWGEIMVENESNHFDTDTQSPHFTGDMAYWIGRLVNR